MITKNYLASALVAVAFGLTSSVFADTPKASARHDSTVEADNSGKNARDADGERALTADDQSLTDSDQTEVLGAIRRAVVDIPNLSVNGQNVKIMVDNKTATLRGPVNSSEEKAAIERTVKKTAPGLAVKNLLEVEN